MPEAASAAANMPIWPAHRRRKLLHCQPGAWSPVRVGLQLCIGGGSGVQVGGWVGDGVGGGQHGMALMSVAAPHGAGTAM